MTLPFLAECCQATSSKSLVQLSTATASSECDWLLCPVQKALFAPAFPDLWYSPSLYLFLCDALSALEEKADKSCSIWRLSTPQTFIFSTVTELKSFFFLTPLGRKDSGWKVPYPSMPSRTSGVLVAVAHVLLFVFSSFTSGRWP